MANERATFYDPANPTGSREAVDIGSDREKELFGKGYKVELKNAVPGSLEGTMTSQQPEPNTGLSRFRSVLQQVSQRALEQTNKNKPVSLSVLESQAGGAPLPPELINQALSNEFTSRQARVKEIYTSTLDYYTAKIEDDQAKRKELLGIAFSEQALLGGRIPDNLPAEYRSLWKTASEGAVKGANKLPADKKLEIIEEYENAPDIINAIETGNYQYSDINIPDIIQPNGLPQRAKQNNNPLNMKIGGLTRKWVDNGIAVLDPNPARHGGNYLRFKNPHDGISAARDLLFNTDFYGNKTVDDAMKTWSGNGYDAGIVPSIDPERLIKDIKDPSEQNTILAAMAMNDSGTTFGPITPIPRSGTMDGYELNILTARMGKAIYGTRISDAESKRVESFLKEGMKMEKTSDQIMDDVLGFALVRNEDLGNTFKNILLAQGNEDGLSGYDMYGLARLLNDDETSGAVNKVEKAVLKDAKDTQGRFAAGMEAVARYAHEKGNEIIKEMGDNLNKFGIVEGNWENVKSKFYSTPEFSKIKADITAFISDWRHEMAGANFTEIEQKALDPIIPSVTNNPFNAMEKIQALQRDHLQKYNSVRSTYFLPELSGDELIDNSQRVGLYRGSIAGQSVDISDIDLSGF